MVIIRAVYIVLLFLPFSRPEISCKSDTVKIDATGVNNQVLINGLQANSDISINDTLKINGQIIQSGIDNSVNISTPKDTAKNKQQINISQT